MKKILLAILAILVFCSACAADIKNSPDGFGGVKWGDPPSALKDRDLFAKGEILARYTKRGDDTSMGLAVLDRIEYVFVHDRMFLGVVISAKHNDNCEKLRDALIARYGKPNMDKAEEARWAGEDVSIIYKHNRNEEIAEAHIFSNKAYAKYLAAQKQ